MYKSKEYLRRAMENAIQTSELVCKSSWDEDEKELKLAALRESMKAYCQIDYNFKKYEQCEAELDKGTSDDPTSSKDFKQVWETFSKKKDNVTQHEMYRKLEEKINEAQRKPDEDLEISETAPNVTCPVSKKIMTRPMRNKLCGHIYDKSSVYELLKLNKRGIKCPVPGCVKAISFKHSDLEPYEALNSYISQLLEKKD